MDNGPGIPSAWKEKIFEPFLPSVSWLRLVSRRSRQVRGRGPEPELRPRRAGAGGTLTEHRRRDVHRQAACEQDRGRIKRVSTAPNNPGDGGRAGLSLPGRQRLLSFPERGRGPPRLNFAVIRPGTFEVIRPSSKLFAGIRWETDTIQYPQSLMKLQLQTLFVECLQGWGSGFIGLPKS